MGQVFERSFSSKGVLCGVRGVLTLNRNYDVLNRCTMKIKKKNITVGKYWTVAELMDVILQDRPFYEESGGGVTFSGGEVLFQAPFAIELAKAIKKAGLHLACETTGDCSSRIFKEFMQYIDFMYYDCKQWNARKHRIGTGGDNKRILTNLELAIAFEVNIHIRIPIIPGFNYDLDDAVHFGELFNKIGITAVELLPFHQFGLKKISRFEP